jgi:hypothetical protein
LNATHRAGSSAAEIVLAGGEKDCCSFARRAVVERRLPTVTCGAIECLHAAAALDADSCGDGFGDERCVQCLARKRGGGKRQRRFRGAPASGEANSIEGHGTE